MSLKDPDANSRNRGIIRKNSSAEQSSVNLPGGAFVNVDKLTKFFHQIKLANKYEKALDIALSIVD